MLADFQQDPAALFARLPVLDEDLLLLAPYAGQWFDAERAAKARDDREHLGALAELRLPVLVSCGWNDLFLEGALELFETVLSVTLTSLGGIACDRLANVQVTTEGIRVLVSFEDVERRCPRHRTRHPTPG